MKAGPEVDCGCKHIRMIGLTYDASASDFVAYDAVTEAEAQSWVWANGVDQSETETALQANITAQINPTEASGVPWSS